MTVMLQMVKKWRLRVLRWRVIRPQSPKREKSNALRYICPTAGKTKTEATVEKDDDAPFAS